MELLYLHSNFLIFINSINKDTENGNGVEFLTPAIPSTLASLWPHAMSSTFLILTKVQHSSLTIFLQISSPLPHLSETLNPCPAEPGYTLPLQTV